MDYRIIKGYYVRPDFFLNFKDKAIALVQTNVRISNTTDTFSAVVNHVDLTEIYYFDELEEGQLNAYGDVKTGHIRTGIVTPLPIEEVNKRLERFNQGYDLILDLLV